GGRGGGGGGRGGGGRGGAPPPMITAAAIAAGYEHSCAIQAGTGAVVCWGNNDFGQATPPSSVDGTAGTASAIAAGGAEFCIFNFVSLEDSCPLPDRTRAARCPG